MSVLQLLGSTPLLVDSAERTSQQANISSNVAITDLTVDVPAGSQNILLVLFIPLYQQLTATGLAQFFITDSSDNEVGRGGGLSLAANAFHGGLVALALVPPSASARQFIGKAQTSAGTITLNASNTAAAKYGPRLWAFKV
jgi:hypothetical protein